MAKTVSYRARRVRNRINSDSSFRHGVRLSGLDHPFAITSQPDERWLDIKITSTQIKQLIELDYLHSTIVGFNADYIEYGASHNILSKGKEYREKGRKDLDEAIKILRTLADQTTTILWGKPVPGLAPITYNNIPTLDHLSRAHYALTQSQTALVSTEWISAYENWAKAEREYNDAVTKNLNEEINFRKNILVPAFQRIQQAIRQMMNSIHIYDKQIHDNIPEDAGTYRKVQDLLQTVYNFNIIDNGVGNINNTLRQLASYFGLRTESLRANDIFGAVQNASDINENLRTNNFKIKQRSNTETLSDIEFEIITEVPKAKSKSITAGVNLKLRRFGDFDLKGTFKLSGQEEDDLQYLFYLYRNILALTTFSSDKMVGHTKNNKRLLVTNRAKYNNLLTIFGPAKQAVIDFNTYITYRLLLLGFVGNVEDAKKGNPLDKTYLEELKQGYAERHSAPPAFIMTGKHIYKTADVLEHYFNLDQRTKEWKNLTNFQKKFSDFSFQYLTKLWDNKRKILQEANESNPNQSVYDVLISHDKELGLKRKNKAKLSFYRQVTIRL